MKRALAILLTVVITILLYACSGDATYQGLTDALASGDYEAVKTELSSLSTDYKAEQEKLSTYRENYGALIEAMEAKDYEKAQEILESRIPTEPQPEYIYVDITLDNWQDYFEINQIEYWSKNDSGEPEFEGYYLTLTVKDEWRDRFPHVDAQNWNGDAISMCSMADQRLAVKVAYSASYYVTPQVDTQTQTVILGSPKTTLKDSATVAISDEEGPFNITDGNSAILYGVGHYSYSNGRFVHYYDSYEITRIEGTIPLLAE